MADESNSVSPPPSTSDRAGPAKDGKPAAQAMEEGKAVSASEGTTPIAYRHFVLKLLDSVMRFSRTGLIANDLSSQHQR